MSGTPGFLDSDSLCANTFVRRVEIHDTLPSTNDLAIQLAASADLVTPALVVARLQTAGRGRSQRTWWSADGALTFSLVLDTSSWGITQCDWPRLSLATAVAVCDVLQQELASRPLQRAGASSTPAAPVPSIKWPNDVFLDGQKICGILIESSSSPALANDRLIIGVGINVNNSWRNAPRETGVAGIALCDITGGRHNLQSLLVHFLNAFEKRGRHVACRDPALFQAWQRLCWLTEHDVVVETGGRTIDGRCLGIADDGALLVKTSLTTERIYSGSVRMTT
jgi:BirA family biotin operon repressor/biotin-[acetyl-CoA-carboxylase] ligase